MLEARRPSRALNEVGDLLARRRERQRVQGVPVSAVRSTFIAGVGYDKATGTMAVAMTGGRLYGYQVPAEVHRAVAESTSPGGAYNAAGERHRPGRHRPVRAVRPVLPGHRGAQLPGAAHDRGPTSTRNARAREAATAISGGRSAPAAPGGVAPASRTAKTSRSTPSGSGSPHRAACCGRRGGRPVSVQHHGQPGGGSGREPLRTATKAAQQRVSNREHAGWTASEQVTAAVARHATSRHVPDRISRGRRRPAWCTSPAPVPTSPATPTPSTHPAHSAPGTATPPPCGTCWPPPPATPGGSNSAAMSSARTATDERIVADRVYLFTDAPTPADAWRQAQDDYGILGALAPPDDIRLVDVPWRPGEKAWLLRWE